MTLHDLHRIMKRSDGTDWELGSGNFGKVLKGMRGGVQPVAIKQLFRRDKAMEEAFIREIAMLKCARAPACLASWLPLTAQAPYMDACPQPAVGSSWLAQLQCEYIFFGWKHSCCHS